MQDSQFTYLEYSSTVCILMDFPIQMKTIRMGVPIVYTSGSQVVFSIGAFRVRTWNWLSTQQADKGFQGVFLVMKIRVAKVREKSLEIEQNPCQGKVREFHFQSGEFRKNGKNLGKRSGKWPKVKEKSVKQQESLKWIFIGNPGTLHMFLLVGNYVFSTK